MLNFFKLKLSISILTLLMTVTIFSNLSYAKKYPNSFYSLQERYNRQIAQGSYQEALRTANAFRELVGTNNNVDLGAKMMGAYYVARAHYFLRNIKEAKELFEISMTLSKQSPPEMYWQASIPMMGLARLHLYTKRYQEALNLSLEALELMKKQFGGFDIRQLNALEIAQNASSLLGNISRSLYYNQLFYTLKNRASISSQCYRLSIGADLRQAGKAYYETDMFSKAADAYECLIRIYSSEKPKTVQNELGGVSRVLADIYARQNRPFEAEAYFKRSTALLSMQGADKVSLALTLNNHCAMYFARSQFKKAAPLCNKLDTVWRSLASKGVQHPGMSNSAYLLQIFEQARANYQEADQMGDRARRLGLRLPSDEIPIVNSGTIIRHVDAFRATLVDRNKGDAVAIARGIERYIRATVGRANYEYIANLSNLSVALHFNGQHNSALTHSEVTMTLCKKIKSSTIARSRLQLPTIAVMLSDSAAAELLIPLEGTVATQVGLGIMEQNYAALLAHSQHFIPADKGFAGALKKIESAKEPNFIAQAILLGNWMVVHQKLGKIESALELNERRQSALAKLRHN